MLLFAFVRGNDSAGAATLIVGLLVGSAVLMAVFVIAELKQRQALCSI